MKIRDFPVEAYPRTPPSLLNHTMLELRLQIVNLDVPSYDTAQLQNRQESFLTSAKTQEVAYL